MTMWGPITLEIWHSHAFGGESIVGIHEDIQRIRVETRGH